MINLVKILVKKGGIIFNGMGEILDEGDGAFKVVAHPEGEIVQFPVLR